MRLLIIVLTTLLVVLQYDMWVGDGSFANVARLEQSVEAQKQENAVLRERNRALEADVKDLKTGLSAIEERARSELGMIKQDETYYQLADQ